MPPFIDECQHAANRLEVFLVPIENRRKRSRFFLRDVIDSLLRIDESDREFLQLLVELVPAKRLPIQ
jgi:hypothetical protein